MSDLETALRSNDWIKNQSDFLAKTGPATATETLERLAIWGTQLETLDGTNPAIVFIRDMQVDAQQATASIALALYKPAAGCIRALFESALYYTFFRVHPAELATLAIDDSYYVSKEQVFSFMQQHVGEWGKREGALGLSGRASKFYARISRIVHGQIPGALLPRGYKGLATICRDEKVETETLELLRMAGALVSDVFLVALGASVWPGMEINAKRALLKGLKPETRQALGLTVV